MRDTEHLLMRLRAAFLRARAPSFACRFPRRSFHRFRSSIQAGLCDKSGVACIIEEALGGVKSPREPCYTSLANRKRGLDETRATWRSAGSWRTDSVRHSGRPVRAFSTRDRCRDLRPSGLDQKF